MPSICFYFQVHQPYRLRHYTFFDIGANPFYEDEDANCDILLKVARKCYLPMNELLYHLIRKHKGQFRVSFSLSGAVIDQFEEYAPEVLDSFQALAKTGCVEFMAETYNHSLAFLFSRDEFRRQVTKHTKRIQELFGQTPTVFRNTELIYNNEVAAEVEKMGYKAILAEGADHILGWRSPNFLYQPPNSNKMTLMLKNYSLSDDIAFRFSNQGWAEHPLTADKYASWLHSINGQGEVINLFMDYETFGEHQWASTGIFEFMRALPENVLRHPDFKFQTPSEVDASLAPKAKLNVQQFMSWADTERDLTAWLGNDMQQDAISALYQLEKQIYALDDPGTTRTWQRLQTSDHFYYMCTKWFSDGDVHKYFNPYGTPYDAYINFMNILADFKLRLDDRMPPDTANKAEVILPDQTAEAFFTSTKELAQAMEEASVSPASRSSAKKATAKTDDKPKQAPKTPLADKKPASNSVKTGPGKNSANSAPKSPTLSNVTQKAATGKKTGEKKK